MITLTYLQAENQIRDILSRNIFYLDLSDPDSLVIDGRCSYDDLRRIMQIIERIQWTPEG